MLTKQERIKLLAERAAELWAEQIQRGHYDNGDDSQAGGFSYLWGTMLMMQARDTITEAGLVKFREQLTKIIVEKMGEEGDWMSMGTDYTPDAYLLTALEGTDINANVFPVKSTVTIVARMTHQEQLAYRFGYTGKYWNQRIENDQLTEPML